MLRLGRIWGCDPGSDVSSSWGCDPWRDIKSSWGCDAWEVQMFLMRYCDSRSTLVSARCVSWICWNLILWYMVSPMREHMCFQFPRCPRPFVFSLIIIACLIYDMFISFITFNQKCSSLITLFGETLLLSCGSLTPLLFHFHDIPSRSRRLKWTRMQEVGREWRRQWLRSWMADYRWSLERILALISCFWQWLALLFALRDTYIRVSLSVTLFLFKDDWIDDFYFKSESSTLILIHV